MKMKKYVELIYNLQDKKTEWCVIEEETPPKDISDMSQDMKILNEISPWLFEEKTEQDSETTYKPGLYVKGTRLYVDLYARRFFTTVEWPGLISRKVHPAKWTYVKGEMVCLKARDDESIFLMLGRNFILDIHNVCWYDKSLEGRLLL